MVRGCCFIMGVTPLLFTGLAGCGRCQTTEFGRQRVSIDGTVIFEEVSHCSALNNSVKFFIDRPRLGLTLLGEGNDLEEVGQAYIAERHEIRIMTSDLTGTVVNVRQVGLYRVTKAVKADSVD